MRNLTKDHAWQIAKKLNARIQTARHHDIAIIEYGGRRIAQFGIRRGKMGLSHNYIASQIFLSRLEALELARCRHDLAWWLAVARAKGMIDT
jgi:hypothetical protein